MMRTAPFQGPSKGPHPISPILAVFLLVACVAPAGAGELCPEPVGSEAVDVAAADFDGDGLADLAVAASPAKVAIVFGVAGPRPTRPGGAILTGAEIANLAAGDVNGDGAADVVAASSQGGYLRILRGAGNGSFALGDPVAAGEAPSRLVVADLNGDGGDDAVVMSQTQLTLTVLLADGAGGLIATETLPTEFGYRDLAVGDIDGDGARDLVLVASTLAPTVTTTLTVWLGNGDGTFGPAAAASTAGGLSALAMGDMNGDGRADVVAASGLAGQTVAVFPGQADGTLGTRIDSPIPDFAVGGRVKLADLDSDGHLDVAILPGPTFEDIGGCLISFLYSLRGVGDGALVDATRIRTSGLSLGLALGDMNGDGKVDAAVAGGQCGTVTVHPGAGDGTFTTLTHPARAFVDRSNEVIRLSSGKPSWCVHFEAVGGSFDLAHEVSPVTIRLVSPGTGVVSEIGVSSQKTFVLGDADGNAIPDLRVCFSKDDLRQLFSLLKGRRTVTVQVEGNVGTPGCLARAHLTIDVIGGGGGNALAASVRPNPLNPEAALSFTTYSSGPLRVRLYDVSGRLVRTLLDDGNASAGAHEVRIDGRDAGGRDLASGVYLYRVESASGEVTGRLVVAR